MALYRCAVCGSPRVVTNVQERADGYSYKKGILGVALFGSIGAVAGMNGKRRLETSYICRDCGVTLSYCMLSDTKDEIDRLQAASSLSLSEYRKWEYYKVHYRNIGESVIDRESKQREQIAIREQQRALNSISSISEAEFVETAKAVYSFYNKIGNSDMIYLKGMAQLPSVEEYRDFCNDAHKLVYYMPMFASYYIESYDSSIYPEWRYVTRKSILGEIIEFDLARDYYDKKHKKIDVYNNEFVYDYFFRRNLHMVELAVKTNVLSSIEPPTAEPPPFNPKEPPLFPLLKLEHRVMKRLYQQEIRGSSRKWFPRFVIKNDCVQLLR